MEDLTQNIYRTFDQEGIKLKLISKSSVGINFETFKVSSNIDFDYIPFPKQRDKLNLTNEEFFEAVFNYIYDTTSFKIDKIQDLEKYPSINNLPFIIKINEHDNEAIIFSLAFGKIPGSTTIKKEHKIISLGNIEEINGTLGLSNTSLSSFGKLKKVTGSLWISYHDPNSKLFDLNEIEEIGGSLLLRGFPIKSLAKLKKVGGLLNLRGTIIEDLGSLEFVGEHIYLPKSKRDYFDFSKIHVGGKIKYFSS